MEKMRNGKSKMEKRKRSLKKDERGVSPVIGVIMMIAIVVIIAAVVAAFAYGIIGGVKKAPSSAMVVEGASANPTGVAIVTIFHHGGDTITGAFKNSADITNDTIANKMAYLEVRLDGAPLTKTQVPIASLNGRLTNSTTEWDTPFGPGDQLTLEFAEGELEEGSSFVLLHKPSENILQRITIA